jgi:Predicted permease, DMT superfamily
MRKSYIKYLLALLIFGSNGIIASNISLSSYEIVLLRTLLGSIFLIAIYLLTRQKITFYKHKRSFVFIAISGAAMGVNWMSLYEAYQQIGVSISTMVCYCGPIIVMALSPVLFKEKLTPIRVGGFVAVLIGVFLINNQALDHGLPGVGLIFAWISAIMYAVLVIFTKKGAKIVGLENAVIQLLFCLITVVLFVGIKQGFVIHIASEDWLPILILGLINTGIGCYLLFSSIGNLPSQTVAISGYLEPLSAVAFAAIFLNEILSSLQIVGVVLIIGGAIVGEVFVKRKSNDSSLL